MDEYCEYYFSANATIDTKAECVWSLMCDGIYDEEIWAKAKRDPIVWRMYCACNSTGDESASWLPFLQQQLSMRPGVLSEEDWLTPRGEMIVSMIATDSVRNLTPNAMAQMVADIHLPRAANVMDAILQAACSIP